ncbi:MAG: GNAT family N-acetyltransferase [Bacteroidetes bacterium]|nr:GNAT family N-acetyltransferase [Bacteroidota bacterium]
MSESPGFRIRPMTISDIDQAMGLSTQEGWNQTETDWKILAESTDNVCIVAEKGGRIIGTATALNHSGKVAWIGMVLVDKPMRGMGAGKLLMTEIIKRLEHIESVKLDATPAGQPLYRSLGFIDESTIIRMTTTSLKSIEYRYHGDKPKNIKKEGIQQIIDHDTSIFGTERSYLLNKLFFCYPQKAFTFTEINNQWGYIFGRNGTNYNYIGPVCASRTEEAMGLITAALDPFHGKSVALDVLADKTDLIKWLESIGFIKQRDFVRMYKGKNSYAGISEFQYLISGPEFG